MWGIIDWELCRQIFDVFSEFDDAESKIEFRAPVEDEIKRRRNQNNKSSKRKS